MSFQTHKTSSLEDKEDIFNILSSLPKTFIHMQPKF